MTITYRQPTKQDIPALAHFAARMFSENFGYLYQQEHLSDHLQATCSEAYFTRMLDEAHLLIACDDEEIIGYAKWGVLELPVENPITPNSEIHRLYVDSTYQSQRIGHHLMQRMLESLEDKPAVYLGVWSENDGAQRFYQRYGFTKYGEYNYMVGPHADHEFIFIRKNDKSR